MTGSLPIRNTGGQPAAWPQAAGWPLAFALVGFVTLLRLAALWISPSELGFDEAQYWAWSRELQFGYATKPPLIAWLIAAEGTVCGASAACVRSAAPLLHAGTALLLALAARRLYGSAAGVWTAVGYVLMPGVALSASLMTTDALLLFFWAGALLALVRYLERPGLAPALAFALAAAAGLYAKYAMVFLLFMIAFAAAALPEVRRRIEGRHAAAALAAILVLLLPNLLWNATNGFATFTHTGEENIGWSLAKLNAVKGFEFLAAQFGVAGPVVFGALVNALVLGARSERPTNDRLLLWLSWPLILAIAVQGFLSKANANWAATAYAAGIILATALMLLPRYRLFLVANLVVSGLASAVLLWTTAFLDPAKADGAFRQFRQLGGWTRSADDILALARDRGGRRLVVEGRALTAGLIWALRDDELPVLGLLPDGAPPADQFEIDAPWRPGDAREGTLLLGVDAEEATALGAVPVGTVAAPLFLKGDGRLAVYGFADP